MNNVCAAILAGGLGTRLRPALQGTPKVLARVHDRPFITFLLDQLKKAAIPRSVLLTGFHADQVQQTLGEHYGDMTLDYSREPTPMGTGGALRLALPKLNAKTILLLNGDSYCNVNLETLLLEHQRRDAEMTLTLCHTSNSGRFGQVECKANGRLSRFVEKNANGRPGWINAGVYAIDRSLIQEMPFGCNISLEQESLPNWVEKRRLFAFQCTGRFLDIGTPDSYAAAAAFFEPESPLRKQYATT